MKQKKFTTTKLIVALSYIITFLILGLIGFVSITMTLLIVNAVRTGQDISALVTVVTFLSTLITQLVAAHVSSDLIRGYITKGYMKKANVENLPWIPVKFLRGLIDLQTDTGYKILDKEKVSSQISKVSDVFTDEQFAVLKELLHEDVTTQAK